MKNLMLNQFLKKDDIIDTIDLYHLNLYCTCLKCEKLNVKGKYNACQAYPVNNGIPPKVWNGKNAKCEHFAERKKE